MVPALFVLYTKPVSAVIDHHSLLHLSVADDAQLQTWGQLSDLQQMTATTQDCISDLNSWMTQNKLQFSEDKTEVLLAIPSKFKNYCSPLTKHSPSESTFQTSAKQPILNSVESVQSMTVSPLMPQKHPSVPLFCQGFITATFL